MFEILGLTIVFTLLLQPFAASHRVKVEQTELRKEYDFIIAGGGTAGLTVADRLTAAFPNRNVLVVEYGDIEPTPGYFDPPGSPPLATVRNYSVPVPTLNNRTAELTVGMTVGGSSAVNGQFFDRASRVDYDDWDLLAGDEPSGGGANARWDWDSLFPYFRKSVTFIEPEKEVAGAMDLTWDYEAAYGGSTPIFSSFVPFQWPSAALSRQACLEAGIASRQECAAGDTDGLCWIPASQHPWASVRSHSGQGHYRDVINDRPNYDLLVRHKVTRVLFPNNTDPKEGPPAVEVRSLRHRTVFTVKATAEVIISAGAIHTPQILQRSGIGPPDLLERAGIDVIADLPGVGYNFQDHPAIQFGVNITKNTTPNQAMLDTDAAYLQTTLDQFAERPARGPWTLNWNSQAVFLPLSNVSRSFTTLAKSLREQIADGSALMSLPPGAIDSVARGYQAQLETLARVFEHPSQPILEVAFGGAEFMTSSVGVPGTGILLKPLSRGAVLIDPADVDAEPTIHYGTLANSLDTDVMASFLPFFRRLWNTTTLRDSAAQVAAWLRDMVAASIEHPCCTAAMMPRTHGGVVGRDLRVHGVGGLRVVDASVFPVVPGAHLSATVYATAETAADMIAECWK
ncbi:choline dehydrogenase [Apiospora arundinis]